MAHELIRVYESGLTAPVLVDRLRSLSGHPLVVELSDSGFSARENRPRQFSAYGRISTIGEKTVVKVSFMNAVLTMLLFGFLSGTTVIWLLIDSLLDGRDAIPPLLIAAFWIALCWCFFWRHVATGIRVLDEVEKILLADDPTGSSKY